MAAALTAKQLLDRIMGRALAATTFKVVEPRVCEPLEFAVPRPKLGPLSYAKILEWVEEDPERPVSCRSDDDEVSFR